MLRSVTFSPTILALLIAKTSSDMGGRLAPSLSKEPFQVVYDVV